MHFFQRNSLFEAVAGDRGYTQILSLVLRDDSSQGAVALNNQHTHAIGLFSILPYGNDNIVSVEQRQHRPRRPVQDARCSPIVRHLDKTRLIDHSRAPSLADPWLAAVSARTGPDLE